jgi:CheY-like chemotaxis protein
MPPLRPPSSGPPRAYRLLHRDAEPLPLAPAAAGGQQSTFGHGARDDCAVPAMSTVLLVDDDLENLWSLQLVLEAHGRHAVLAESGREALQTLMHVLPRLIVTDFNMPEMDGAEFCRRVRCQPAFANLPIVLLSAEPEPAGDGRCWSAYFRKPADLALLMRYVDMFIADRLATLSRPRQFEQAVSGRWQPVNSRCWP